MPDRQGAGAGRAAGMKEVHFVYDGTEVKKTGRTATRKLPGTRLPLKEHFLVEITPVEPDGWKKWVDPVQLFTVNGDDA